NTHQHFDHTFGNLAFEGATIHAHQNAAAGLVAAGDRIKDQIRADPAVDPDYPAITAEVLDAVLASDYLLTERSVVVPGHGTPVDKTFVQDQRADVADVGQLVRSLFAQGVSREDALEAGGDSWPYPARQLSHAVSRGYAQLAAEARAAGNPDQGRSPAQPPLHDSNLPLL
ncbi:MAG: hypothetical protein ABJA93_11030, partial [Sporichthyaceae bacterium]